MRIFRKVILSVLFFLSAMALSFAQIFEPVKWSYETRQTGENEYELVFKATIEDGWHLYSQFIKDGGPIKTSFNFDTINAIELLGKVEERGELEQDYDPNFEMELKWFSHEVEFVQKVKLKTEGAVAKGWLEFMTCDDQRCLPPESIDYEFVLGTPPESSEEEESEEEEADKETFQTEDKDGNGEDESDEDSMSFWGVFIAGFLGGFIALLTPCVFPMIPLTVSFFTKQSDTKAKGIFNAIAYGISIIVIYVVLGFAVTKILGPDALNAMASNAVFNLLFFFVFIIFAISFFGAFEITVPASWTNKSDQFSEKGGLIGIFFMAFTLALVSFSCTGPIIGTLLVEAAVGGNVIGPVVGMLGFSIALALPFGLFAAFPGWLNSLPKSGGWLNSVKVVLGFLELALCLKFLSNVDLAYHWGVLTREIFIALWIIIFTLMGFYLLGKLKFVHDSDTAYISIPRLFMAILTFSFVVYLVPGMWGAPLKIISGFPPPAFYTEGWSIGGGSASADKSDDPIGVDRSHCPHNLPCFHDYDLALEHAKASNLPLMIDFTGWSCVNCRKMEDKVWIDPRVLSRLENDFVLVSLYVDDKTSLPESEVYRSETTGKMVKTLGNKWSDLQTRRFGTNSQPLYVLLDHDEELLVKSSAYDPDIEKYIRFLDSGKEEFAKRSADNDNGGSLFH